MKRSLLALLFLATPAFGADYTRTDNITSNSGGPVAFPAGATVPSSASFTAAGITTLSGVTTISGATTLSGAVTPSGGIAVPSTAVGTLWGSAAEVALTAGTNVAAVVTPVSLEFYRIGNTVCVYGQVSIDPTSSATASTFVLATPIVRAVNFSGTGGATGHAGILGAEVGSCLATNAAKTVTCNYISGGTAVELVPVSFCYAATGH